MIGFLRLALALLVVQTHLGSGHYGGRFAVIGFYVLSGYLMTLLCCGPYTGRVGAFWVNRLLRVFPVYWLIYAVSIVWLWRFPGNPWGVDVMGLGQWYEGLGIVTVRDASAVPQAWALSVELFWWALISIGIAATPRRCWVWMGLSSAFVVVVGAWPLSGWYNSLWFGSFWFALGAAGYHAGLRLPRDRGLAALAGEMAYPLYLCHMLIGAMLGHWLEISRGWPLFWVGVVPTLALSWVLVVLVERPIQRYRLLKKGTQNA